MSVWAKPCPQLNEPYALCRESERQSAPDVVVVDTVEAHEVSANVTVETSAPAKVRSQSDQALINFGLAIPHDILLGKF